MMMMAPCVYAGPSFQPEVTPTDHPIWKVLLTFLSRVALPKKTQARLVLAPTQPPASAGKPKTFTQLGRDARSPQEFVRARAARPTRGAPLKGPVFPSAAKQAQPDSKHRGHPREAREKVLENEGQPGPGGWGWPVRGAAPRTVTPSAQARPARPSPHLCPLPKNTFPRKGQCKAGPLGPPC